MKPSPPRAAQKPDYMPAGVKDRAALQKLYGSQRWRNRARRQLQQQPWCTFCLANNEPVVATVADHVHPHKGDPHQFWFGELQSLCRPCHEGRKKFVEQRGFDNAVGLDGWPLDPRHPCYTGKLPEKPKPAPPIDVVDKLIPD
jgi:hypothetical protein